MEISTTTYILGLLTSFIVYYMAYVGYRQKKKGLRPKEQTAKNFKILSIMALVMLVFLPFVIIASKATQMLIVNGLVVIAFLGNVGWLIYHIWKSVNIPREKSI